MGEIVRDDRTCVNRTFSFLLGFVKVQHVLIEQYFRGSSQAITGLGPYRHQVNVYVFGNEVFAFEIECKAMPKVFLNGNEIVGDHVILRKKL